MNSLFEAKIIEDSISPAGVRLTTLQLRYPRFIHAEFMTHRVFSRNASSSRAIPVAKVIEQVRNDPAMPVHWGKNEPGMQAGIELTGFELIAVKGHWGRAAFQAAETAEHMMTLGAHKQVVNRILEPFQWMSVIVTATEWDNFFELRDHADAEPNIQLLAQLMKAAMAGSTPRQCDGDYHYAHAWHLPYVTAVERTEMFDRPRLLTKLSGARCARVSYLTHDGQAPDLTKDVLLYERLVGSRPLHASPVEHQAWPMAVDEYANGHGYSGNFRGWHQYRKSVEAEASRA